MSSRGSMEMDAEKTDKEPQRKPEMDVTVPTTSTSDSDLHTVDFDTRGKLKVISVKITEFAKLDACEATMLNKSGSLETVRLCILIKGADQYTKSLHRKWRNILWPGTELQVELIVDVGIQLVVYLHNPTEEEFSDMYEYMVANGEVIDGDDDHMEEDTVPEPKDPSSPTVNTDEPRGPSFSPYGEQACQLKPMDWRARALASQAQKYRGS